MPLLPRDSEHRKSSAIQRHPIPAPIVSSSTYVNAIVNDGLRTPPAEDMSTVYPSQIYSSHVPRQDSSYTFSVKSSSAAVQPCSRGYETGKLQSNPAPKSDPSAQPYGRIQSPKAAAVAAPAEEGAKRKNLILPNLQIPSSVNNSGGSLGEFAAQITCLFWFESVATLHQAEESSSAMSPVQRLVPDAMPTTPFRKWVVTILSTTQVTPNVILLALLFIYRLKTLNPTVKGRAGSEYRLLTVALMLANKFLDDNTYTNKTWAEVSGISVGEIHVMEVEFLSNMRYSLLASMEQWNEWQIKLGKFSEFCEQSAKVPTAALPSPLAGNQPILPSPPSSMRTSPPALSSLSSNSAAYNYNHQWPAQQTPPIASHLPSMPDLVHGMDLNCKKRGRDETAEEPPAKRTMRVLDSQIPVGVAGGHQVRNNVPRLPPPTLSISTGQPMNVHPSFAPSASLLPLPSGRAMSTIYPNTPAFQPQSQGTLTPSMLLNNNPPSVLHGTQYGTPSRRQSPRSVHDMMSLHSSPISASFPSHAQSSPSFFLQQRSSPYKPIRLPNTLLHPPPSAFPQAFHLTSIEQMHYQPLGKRNDYRSGVVPDYVPQGSYQHWPALPQPTFYN
ncbi:MAG: hypothetical protein M1818_007304 [Claussenomyces sp. TS43310]|nr:MAG: hypothetical protein M1818_007304 [Claussenomyces sp. TS43310]